MAEDGMPTGGDSSAPSWARQARLWLGSFATRVLVHLFSLVVSVFVLSMDAASTADAGLSGFLAFKFAAYVGLVCLIPRGHGMRADWIGPTGAGIALVGALAFLGVPVSYGLIWGGGATWLIRLLLRKGRLDWEMAALPWLVVGLASSDAGQFSGGQGVLWLTSLAVVALGWAGTFFFARLRARLAQRARTPQEVEKQARAARIDAFRASSAALQGKARLLPGQVRMSINGIVAGADKILACMCEDPEDMVSGDRFLSRYLKAAHGVVDEYARLSAQGGMQQPVADALIKSEALLNRLQKAFEEEHSSLLRNDTVDFTAELNVLDKLLKMDGR
jgi:hypothetical protein